jgi:hypothetical protein
MSILILNFGSMRHIGCLLVALFFILTVAIIGGYSRERMMHVGDFYDTNNDHKISTGYFADFHIGKRMKNV